MPSFDISSEVDKVALKNAIDTTDKQITNRMTLKVRRPKLSLMKKIILLPFMAITIFSLTK